MIREITIGQFYQAESVVHKMDPRVKLIATIAYIISLFIYKNLTVYLIATLFLIVVIKSSKVPFKFIVRGIKPILFLLLFTATFNVFLTPGKELVEFWIFHITKEGLTNAVYVSIRLVLLMIGSSLMTLTTTPNNLTDGLEKLMRPLRHIKVPVHEIAMMMSIALRFIPILLEETDKIMKAQMARGADFESGNLVRKVKAMIPLMVPLFISAFRRANDLAMAMEARCYQGGDGRTKMKPLKYGKRDAVAYFIVLCYVIVLITFGKYLPLTFLK